MSRFPIVLAALVALAHPVCAQRNDTLALPRFTVTPYVGGRIPFGTEQTFFGPDSTTGVFLDEERGGGSLVGLDAELRVRGAFSAVAGVAYSTAGDVVFTVVELGDTAANAQRFTRAGSTYLLAKAGIAYRLPVPSPDSRRFRSLGSIVAGPALVRETPARQSAINHLALNLGYKALLPLGTPRVALHLAFEDYLTFWNTDEYERRGPGEINQPGLAAEWGSPRGNLFLFHSGLAIRFGGQARAIPFQSVAPLPAPEPAALGTTPIRVCVVDGGELREIDAMLDAASGDTTVNQRRFSEAYPGATEYAAGRDFYVRGEAIPLNRIRYVPVGLARIIPAGSLMRTGEYQGVPIFRDRGAAGTPEVLYLPVRTGCEFQAYRREREIRGVRG